MKILVIGGTRFFGIPMINNLLEKGHQVTIATRGTTPDAFGSQINRILLDCTDPNSLDILKNTKYDVVIHKIAYSSNDIRNLLDRVHCDKFIHMSSASVYGKLHPDSTEEEFDELHYPLIWCDRQDFDYAEIKRQAECALAQCYGEINWAAVRMPYVIGKNDYTRRLYFYVENTIREIPMKITNPDSQLSFIDEDEAGRFMSYLVDHHCQGSYNASAKGTISVKKVIEYTEKKTGCKAVFSEDGKPAPYNGSGSFSIKTDKAESIGFKFSNLNEWIYDLLDYYIQTVLKEKEE